jgi:hypothetical protein
MRNTAAILLPVVLAMFITPLRLPAASCILSNAPSQEACKSDCCANMTCCAVSKDNTGPESQPLTQQAPAKHQLIGLVATALIGSRLQPFAVGPIFCASLPVRAHAPPLLALNCIQLI